VQFAQYRSIISAHHTKVKPDENLNSANVKLIVSFPRQLKLIAREVMLNKYYQTAAKPKALFAL